ncbi:TPA: sterol desaturase family protein [Legionella pneumophila]|uniref:sterol desaturase family protein n=1 Tax=Legionella pneumophila TaxID=446 RepID=UPI000786DA05|nr:sterol desaturase family protein [Legionella pneumophila]HAU1192690.1 sterol desaturase family protein [Legionella pneumophila]HBD7102065.1 sterol desaturase family protein [Legionella pneumophila]HCO4738754.1 sterol desaturase family protein [Legionella pneumophila]HDU7929670.1 sterol desaturase family protein [Legionella pneumophila]HDU7935855.1 sterol desaturase family protein [Legionella pneumophila]
MDINLIVFASPLFLILIGIEYWVAYYKKSGVYQLNDSVNNFSSGILEEIGALPIKGLIIYGYYYLYEHYAIFNINPQSIFSWLFLWIGVDFFYYWYHRVSHRNTFFWIGHSVHHQSEQFNLSVALRQGYFQTLTSWVFYLPLALIGFPTWMFVIVASINTIYQFWIHTESIRKMGWFEKIFNTPSHHRVHHGKNPQYIDKNYAGSLIIWDKLFGTFEPEKEPADYGVTEPLDSWNPFYANIKVVKDILYYGKGLKNKWDVLRAFFMPPEWVIHRLQQENSPVSKKITVKKNTRSPAVYMLINTAFAVFLYTYLSLIFDPAIVTSWLIGALILLTLYTLGRVADGNTSILYLEIVRATLVLLILLLLKNTLLLSLGFSVLFYVINYTLCTTFPYKRTASSF